MVTHRRMTPSRRPGDRFVADSPLEGARFELPVPRKIETALSRPVLSDSATSRSTEEIDPGDPTVWLQTEAVAIEFHCGAPR